MIISSINIIDFLVLLSYNANINNDHYCYFLCKQVMSIIIDTLLLLVLLAFSISSNANITKMSMIIIAFIV